MNLMYVGSSPSIYIPVIDAEVANGGTVEIDDDLAVSLLEQGVEEDNPQWVRVAEGHVGPAKSASKPIWVAYAASLGFTADQLGGLSRDELIDLVESGTPADSVKGDD